MHIYRENSNFFFFFWSALNLEYATIIAGYLIKITKNESCRFTWWNTAIFIYLFIYLKFFLVDYLHRFGRRERIF